MEKICWADHVRNEDVLQRVKEERTILHRIMEFSLQGKIPKVAMVWVVSRFSLKVPPGISSSCISALASSGQRSHTSWASQPQKSYTIATTRRETTKVHKNMWWHWGGREQFANWVHFRLLCFLLCLEFITLIDCYGRDEVWLLWFTNRYFKLNLF